MDLENLDATAFGQLAKAMMKAGAEEIPANAEPAASALKLPGFVLFEQLGSGGMGVVYRAMQLEPERVVAIKFPNVNEPNPHILPLFRAEVAALSSLDHPHVARVYGAKVTGGTPYLIMEYVDGTPIDVALGPQPDLRTALSMFKQLAEAVSFVHSHSVLHGDIKPANILVTKSGVKLVDFGLAKLPETDGNWMPAAGRTAGGTRYFSAPEQWTANLGGMTPRSDVFSLGAVLHHLLLGRPPADNADGGLVRGTQRLPQDISALLDKALQRDPDLRYDSAAALAQDIDNFLTIRPLQARGGDWKYVWAKNLRRNFRQWLAASLVVAASGYHLWSTTQQTHREAAAKDSALAANRDLNRELSHSEFVRGAREMRAGEVGPALAWFAKSLRRNPGNLVAARAAAHTVLHGGLLVHAGESKLNSDFHGEKYSSPPALGRGVQKQPGAEDRHFINTAAGMEWRNMQTGEFLGWIHKAKQYPGLFCFDAMGSLVVSAERDAGLRISRLSGGTCSVVAELALPESLAEVAFVSETQIIGFHASKTTHRSQEISVIEHSGDEWKLVRSLKLAAPVVLPHGFAILKESGLLVWPVEHEATLARLNFLTGEALQPTESLPEPPSSQFLISCGGGIVATSGERHQYTVDAVQGKLVHKSLIPGNFWPTGPVPQWAGECIDLRMAGDGTRLVASADLRVRAMDAATGQLSRPPMEMKHPIRSLHTSEAMRFAVVDYNGGVQVWDRQAAVALCPRLTLDVGQSIFCAGFNGGGLGLWTISGTTLHHWRIRDRFAACQECATAIKGQWNARISLDRAWTTALLTTPSGFAGTFDLKESTAGEYQPTHKPPHVPPVGTPDDFPGGIGQLSLDGKTAITWETPEALLIQQAKPWKVQLADTKEKIARCSIRGSGRHLVAGGMNGTLAVWDLQTQEKVHESKPFTGAVEFLEWAGSEQLLATSDANGAIQLFETKTWQPRPNTPSSPKMPAASIRQLRFHPSEKCLYVALFDPPAVWRGHIAPDHASVAWEAEALYNCAAPGRCLAISPAGDLLAVGLYNGDAIILESATGKEIRRISHTGSVRDLQFSGDGKVLATCGADAEVHLWDTHTGEPITPPLQGRHVDTTKAAMHTVQFSPDGQRVASTNGKGGAYLWQVFQPDGHAPAWFMDWLEAMARTQVSGESKLQALPPRPPEALEQMVQGEDAYARLARSLLGMPK